MEIYPFKIGSPLQLTPFSCSSLELSCRKDAASYHMFGWCPMQRRHCS